MKKILSYGDVDIRNCVYEIRKIYSSYDGGDRSLCYNYFWYPTHQAFFCRKCNDMKRIYVSARVHKDENEKEYLRLGKKKHICKPLKFDKVITSKCKILESTGFAEVEKQKVEEIENIITKENFVLTPHPNSGKPDTTLLIFHSNDRSLCYRYFYFKSRNKYFCTNCNEKKKIVTAKLEIKKENGEKYLTLNNAEHICTPLIYEEFREIRNYNFKIFEKNKSKILILFTSNDQKNCYKYSFDKRSKNFNCCGCYREEKRYIIAKIWNDENGKEYVKFGANPHICTPEQYQPEKYEKIHENQKILATDFELFPNSKGSMNSRLIIFNQNNPNLIYDYGSNDSKKFYCYQCLRIQNKYIFAKLSEDQSYLEIQNTEHFCEPRNLVERDRMFYYFNIEDSSNEVKIVTITDCKKLKITRKFKFDNDLQLYCCEKCKVNGRFITYKVRKFDESKEALVLNEFHSCYKK